MLFPKDRPIYPRLRTSFTRFEALVAELEAEQTTGCLRLEFPGFGGWILFSEGEPIASLSREGATRHAGPAGARRINSRAEESGGTIEVYGLDEELVRVLAGCLDATPVYEGLSTDFANPDRLIARLREDGHTGHIDILLNGGRGEATILLQEGSILRAVLVSDGQTFAGPDVVQSIVQLSANLGATFNVYRAKEGGVAAQPEDEPEETPADPAELAEFWSEMLSRAERTVDRIATAGRFASTFSEVVAERGEHYEYFDASQSRFTYAGGVASFVGTPPADVSGELGACLLDTLARLAFRLKRADLESKVLADVSDLHFQHPEIAERLPQRAQALVS
jgi:hypothetical protein